MTRKIKSKTKQKPKDKVKIKAKAKVAEKAKTKGKNVETASTNTTEFSAKDRERLRKEAERSLKSRKFQSKEKIDIVERMTGEDLKKLIHELQVHQSELEIQNGELRAAQQQLEESRNRYIELYDFAPAGYFTFDKSGGVIETNLIAAQMFGVPRGMLVKQPFIFHVSDRDRKTFYSHINKVLESGERQTCELILKRKDGSLFPSHLESIRIADRSGEKYLCRTVVSDITEQKRAEDEIKRFASFPQLNPNPVLEVDLEGKIIFCNDATDRILRELNLEDENVFLPEDMTNILKNLGQENESQFYREVKIKDRIFGESLYFAPQFNSVRLYAIDITERKSYQEALQNAFQESRQREAEISALLEGSSAVLKYADFQGSARAIFDSCKNLIGATSGYIAMVSKDGTENEVLFLDLGGRSCTVDPTLPMPIRGLRGEAYHNAKTIYCNDFAQCEWIKFLPEGHVSLENVLMSPMILDEKVVGLLGLANKAGGFTENDANMASAFADLAAIALTQKRAEEALRHSEEYFRLVTDNALDIISLIGADGTIRYGSFSIEQVLGYKPEDLIGKNAFELVHPDDLPKAMEVFSQAIQTPGNTLSIELRSRRKDGSWRILEVKGKNLLDNPAVAGIVISSRDITERKQAEQRLVADLDALMRIHALSGSLLQAGGLQPLLQEIMDAAVVIMGAEKGTLQLLEGDSLRIVVHHGHKQPFLEFFASAENRTSVCGEAMRCGERIVVPDVETSFLFSGTPSLTVLLEAGVRAVQSTPILSRTGALLGILTTQWGVMHSPDEHDLWRLDLLARQAADLIEQSRYEQALRESEQRLFLAKRAAELGIHDYDIRSGKIEWDQRTQELWGVDPDEEITYDVFMAGVNPDDRSTVQGVMDQALDPSGTHKYYAEYRVINRKDGVERWIVATGDVFFDQGQAVRLVGTVQDITEGRRAEEALEKSRGELAQRNTELEIVNKDLEAFSYTISHDLKSPLRSIQGFAQAIIDDYNDKLDNEGRDFLSRITSAVERMTQLIDAMLEISRLTSRDMISKSVNLSSIAEVIAYELKKDDPGRQAEFIIAKGMQAQGDLDMLEIVLRNLLDNAWKFTSKHSSAKIEFGAFRTGGFRNPHSAIRNRREDSLFRQRRWRRI